MVTGGYGFIGSCFALRQIKAGNLVVNIDNLSYSANLQNLIEIESNQNYHYIKGDICDQKLISQTLEKFDIDWIVNFAAESHVDNSISGP